ncbi:MAG TPA: hypothetical protein ENJ18_03205 [Nannocystis exedens]|nr:hypothetical protein [Nannocystis exedens]
MTRPIGTLTLSIVTAALLVLACGKPASPGGGDEDFAQAGIQGGGEPLVSGKSLELVSWLVQFNRLNSPEKLEAVLNKSPGKFVPTDVDGDGTQDYIAVFDDPEPERDKHALLLRARPTKAVAEGEDEGVLVATLFFNEDWGLTGYSRSMRKVPPPSATAVAVAASAAAAYSVGEGAATVAAVAPTSAAHAGSANLAGSPGSALLGTDVGSPAAVIGQPAGDPSPSLGASGPAVIAVPAGSAQAAGLSPSP